MELLNLISCTILLGFSTWAILHPNFKDGIVMKLGLILLSFSSLAGLVHYFDAGYRADAQTALSNASFAVIALSMIWRRIHRPVWGEYEH